MTGTVLPCPFCAEGDASLQAEQIYGCAPMQYIGCKCGAQGPRGYTDTTARHLWNRRPTNPNAPPLPPLPPT